VTDPAAADATDPGPEPEPEAGTPAGATDPEPEPGAPAGERGTPGIPRASDDRAERGTPGVPTRPRGLSAPLIPGGEDPDLDETLRRQRPYMRLLIGMVVVIVGGTLVLTILAIASSIIYR
jgi:hypothetical protein